MSPDDVQVGGIYQWRLMLPPPKVQVQHKDHNNEVVTILFLNGKLQGNSGPAFIADLEPVFQITEQALS